MTTKRQVEYDISSAERFILMLLYSGEGKVRGKLWFQKEMFELHRAFEGLADELDFVAYSYGPFSEGLDEYRDMLENSGLIDGLKLTSKGYEMAKELWERANDREKEIVKATVNFLENLDDDELLLYIYITSPQMAEESDVRDQILRRRVEIALKMLNRGKVSKGLAAKLAGLSITELVKEAVKQGIKPFNVHGDVEGKN